jgi:S-adenosylmethionine hydrolase
MKGVIFSINPDAHVTDISHMVTEQNIVEGAFTLASAAQYFPPGTVHIAVVDPGVGSTRKPIVIETERYYFVGPDNGVLSLAIRDEKIKNTFHITNKELLLPQISSTFHGRDIFAPVAAHLSLGMEASKVGEAISNMRQLNIPAPKVEGASVSGRIIHIDRFGNLITNINYTDIKDLDADLTRVTVDAGQIVLRGIHGTYSSVGSGELIALISSSGFLEIAANMARAVDALGSRPGDSIRVTAR